MSDKPEHIGVDSKSAVERDRIDLNHEISGEPTGRIPRFLTENHHALYGGESEKKQSEYRYRTMLQMLLEDDAQYAKLYYEVQDTLNIARRAADNALDDINRQLEEAERALQHMRDNAARLDDGTLVFCSTVDGHVYTEDGRQLSDDEAQNIQFSVNAPGWEDFNTQREKIETLKKQEVEVITYKRKIDEAEERLHDQNDPLLPGELEKIKRDISENKLFSYGAATQPVNGSVAQNISEDKNLDMPPMNMQFDVARLGLSDRNSLPQFADDKTLALTL